MKHPFRLFLLGFLATPLTLLAQIEESRFGDRISEVPTTGNVNQRSQDNRRSQNFNPNSNDTSTTKPIPMGLYVWTVDRRFGDIRPTEPDTMPHLFMRTTFNEGQHGEYNTTGNNYTARQNRIFIDRRADGQFIFTQPYSYVNRQPDEFRFTNTLSPITNMSYYSCGDKTNGEDRIDALFAVNANKRLGGGFDLNYAYARGYFSNQSTSHFNATFFTSYLGDHYQMHLLLTKRHQKTAENGGISRDDYIVHPESFSESYSENEIPTVLSQNWNRNDNEHVFLTHRYNLGFYRELPKDTTAVKAADDKEEQADSVPKRLFVPVTNFIHTLELDNYRRSYIAYETPNKFYANTYLPGDSIGDDTRHFRLKNTLALALVEGFNKYAKAGLKAFVAHEVRRFQLPDTLLPEPAFHQQSPYTHKMTEHTVSIGGKLSKTEGKTLHYNATAELWVAGEDAGQLKADFDTDLNFRFLGDTVQLAASAYLHRLNPLFYQRHYHARNFWWDNEHLDKETRTRIEGRFSYRKTRTQLRVAIEEIQNYTYFGMSYDRLVDVVSNMQAGVYQKSGNISLLTAQLQQDFQLGPLHWDNVVTYQNSSDKDVLPLPALNVYSNLYLHFKVAGVLTVDLGADATYFTKYNAPEFCPMLNQFAVQQNAESRVELGEYPFVNAYANMHLKHARFFIMMTNLLNGSANRKAFTTAHYPTNSSILRFGLSWNFFN